eukprot:47753-Eustigmatos_ZCMA.PRE.1
MEVNMCLRLLLEQEKLGSCLAFCLEEGPCWLHACGHGFRLTRWSLTCRMTEWLKMKPNLGF